MSERQDSLCWGSKYWTHSSPPLKITKRHSERVGIPQAPLLVTMQDKPKRGRPRSEAISRMLPAKIIQAYGETGSLEKTAARVGGSSQHSAGDSGPEPLMILPL